MTRFSFKIILLFSFGLLLVTATVVANADEGRENSLEPGSWSIQYKINENFQLAKVFLQFCRESR